MIVGLHIVLRPHRVLAPHSVLGLHRVLGPHRVLAPQMILGPGSSQCTGSCFSGMVNLNETIKIFHVSKLASQLIHN